MSFFTRLVDIVTGRPSTAKPVRALLCGLDAGGKTTLMYKTKTNANDPGTVIPTVGFSVETMDYTRDNIEISSFDVGGSMRIRPLLRHYTSNTDLLIFVVDGNDHERIEDAATEFRKLYEDCVDPQFSRNNGTHFSGVLVIINKIDLLKTKADRLRVFERVYNEFGLHDIEKTGEVQSSVIEMCAVANDGLAEYAKWMRRAADRVRGIHREEAALQVAPAAVP